MKVPPLTIPDDTQKNNILVVGNTGGGKSNTCRGIVEYNLSLGRRTLVIDITGDWWGLKSSRDGKSNGYPVTIFGGEHADIEIQDGVGARLGELLATSNTPAVIDLQLFSPERIAKFLTPLFEALYMKNREVIHVTLDEAHRYIPQNPRPFQARLLHHVTDMVTGGRSRGFKMMVVTQRPAKLNKDPIAMCKTFVMHEITSSHDRKAIKGWIEDGEGMDGAKLKEILGSLPTLPTGEAWVWIPKMGVLERRKFPLAQTFDSGAAPEDGKAKIEPKVLAPIDVEKIRELLKPPQKAAKPAAAPKMNGIPSDFAKQTPDHHAQERAYNEGYKVGFAAGKQEARAAGYNEAIEVSNKQWQRKLLGWRTQIDKAAEMLTTINFNPPELLKLTEHPTAPQIPKVGEKVVVTGHPIAKANGSYTIRASSSGLKGPEQKVVDGIAWWSALGINEPTGAQICAIAGYSPTSSTLSVILSKLKREGLVTYENGGVVLTDEGLAGANSPSKPNHEELRTRINDLLTGPERKAIEVIFDHYPSSLTHEEICEATGYSPESSTMSIILSALRRYTFIEKREIKAADWLFQ